MIIRASKLLVFRLRRSRFQDATAIKKNYITSLINNAPLAKVVLMIRDNRRKLRPEEEKTGRQGRLNMVELYGMVLEIAGGY